MLEAAPSPFKFQSLTVGVTLGTVETCTFFGAHTVRGNCAALGKLVRKTRGSACGPVGGSHP